MLRAKYCAMVLAVLAAVFVAAAMPATAKELSVTHNSSASSQVIEQHSANKFNETAAAAAENANSISYSQRKTDAKEKRDLDHFNAVQSGAFVTLHN